MKLSEVRKDNDFFRIDSDYFKKELLTVLTGNLMLEPLGGFVKDGYRVVYENTKVVEPEIAKEKNLPIFLQATDIQTPFINRELFSYVDESDWINYPKGRVQRGEILIEVKGKAEKAAFVPDDFPEKTLISGSLYKLTVNQKINKLYLLIYLISKYGQAFKERAKTNLLISFISKYDLYKIPVPVFSSEFQKQIETVVKEAHGKLEQSKRLYAEAESLLLDELGLRDWQPTEENTAVKSFKESFLASGRLDAEYYQPKYDQLENAIEDCKYEKHVLGSLIEPIKNGAEFRDFVEEGIPYIRVGDVKGGRINLQNAKKISPPDASYTKDVKLQIGDILFTRKGSFGNSAIVGEKELGAIISSEIMLLRLRTQFKEEVLPQYLSLFLNSKFGFLQVERRVHGVAFYSISQPDLAAVQVIIPPIEIQTNIVGKISESMTTERESKRLLETAKRGVEMAIERNERAALELINSEIGRDRICS